jgi:hypothetical protein
MHIIVADKCIAVFSDEFFAAVDKNVIRTRSPVTITARPNPTEPLASWTEVKQRLAEIQSQNIKGDLTKRCGSIKHDASRTRYHRVQHPRA